MFTLEVEVTMFVPCVFVGPSSQNRQNVVDDSFGWGDTEGGVWVFVFPPR